MAMRHITKTRDALESKIDALNISDLVTIDINTKKQIKLDLIKYHILYRQHCGEEYK